MDFRKPLLAMALVIGLGLNVTVLLHAQDDADESAAEETTEVVEESAPAEAASAVGTSTIGGGSPSFDALPQEAKEAARAGSLKTWEKYVVSFGWIIFTTIGYAIGIGFALFVFDLITTNIDEWKEIANGNLPVAIIFATIIVSIGIIVYNVI